MIAARYGPRSSTGEIVAFATAQPEDVQRLLLPVLLLDGGRAALTLAFTIFARPTDDGTRRDAPWSGGKLTVERREDVVEILAALPTTSASAMIATRSLAFGPLDRLSGQRDTSYANSASSTFLGKTETKPRSRPTPGGPYSSSGTHK